VLPGNEPLWTVDEASAVFARAGVPIDAARLRLILRALQWQPYARAPSGEAGGAGAALYRSSDLQRLHAALVPFLRLGPSPRLRAGGARDARNRGDLPAGPPACGY
jgi:hypothetical protein